MTATTNRSKTITQALLWILTAIIGRIIPHPNNMTPLTSLALFSGFSFKRGPSLLITLLSLLISDSLLSWIYGYPLLGSWSIFTYSGYLLIALTASFQPAFPKLNRSLIYTLVATCGYWLWTNFGTWLVTFDMYPHTLAGLTTCYIAALPFLRNALIGSLAWSLCIYKVANYYSAHKKPVMNLL